MRRKDGPDIMESHDRRTDPASFVVNRSKCNLKAKIAAHDVLSLLSLFPFRDAQNRISSRITQFPLRYVIGELAARSNSRNSITVYLGKCKFN